MDSIMRVFTKGNENTAERGQWFVFERSALEHQKQRKGSTMRHVAIVCPTCGRASTLSSQIHTVDANGLVRPSFVCKTVSVALRGGECFHEFIKLDGW